jgi:hypothetical protein
VSDDDTTERVAPRLIALQVGYNDDLIAIRTIEEARAIALLVNRKIRRRGIAAPTVEVVQWNRTERRWHDAIDGGDADIRIEMLLAYDPKPGPDKAPKMMMNHRLSAADTDVSLAAQLGSMRELIAWMERVAGPRATDPFTARKILDALPLQRAILQSLESIDDGEAP